MLGLLYKCPKDFEGNTIKQKASVVTEKSIDSRNCMHHTF